MKKIIYILFAFVLSVACEDEEVYFENTLALQDLSFTPVSGGAVMHYNLPADDEIISIKIRYQDFKGDDVTIEGSYACDSLVIVGFNEAQKGVPARVSLCNRQEQESSPIDVTFDTEDSGSVSFFKTVDLQPYWGGFELTYTGVRRANGYANIFYEGKNPLTGEPDLIFVERIIIQQGEHNHKFSLKQQQDAYTVIIRTEDFRGYTVAEKRYEDIGANSMEKLDPANFTFTCPLSMEDESQHLGISYLFDGDKKGYPNLGLDADDTRFYTFLAGPNAVGEPMKIHFNTPQTPSSVRIYTQLNVRFYGIGIYNFCYYNRLPCSVTVYGANTPDIKASWVELKTLEESRTLPAEYRWCSKAPGLGRGGNVQTEEQLDGMDEQYWEIQLPVIQEKYTDLILVVNDVFAALDHNKHNENDQKYVTFNELEIYVKK